MRTGNISLIGIVIALACYVGANAAESPPAPFLTTTISDIGRPYTVIGGGCATAVYPPITLADGFAQTINAAFKGVADQGKAVGADALVGMSVSWETPNTVGSKGRVLICGTFVKFK